MDIKLGRFNGHLLLSGRKGHCFFYGEQVLNFQVKKIEICKTPISFAESTRFRSFFSSCCFLRVFVFTLNCLLVIDKRYLNIDKLLLRLFLCSSIVLTHVYHLPLFCICVSNINLFLRFLPN